MVDFIDKLEEFTGCPGSSTGSNRNQGAKGVAVTGELAIRTRKA